MIHIREAQCKQATTTDKVLYQPEDIDGPARPDISGHSGKFSYERDLNNPGQFPFTRGVHPDMYLGQLWTMRQFSGFGTAKDTNKRYKFLLSR